ncbi:hemerythrin domain-containing protein [Streptomyces sp. NPDC018026]|uniref:hemerythrin domain-containing protein n=1 Tax=Streptomyces sp. NPDC018026 TaxID=3365031 RepID=UPI00379E35C3
MRQDPTAVVETRLAHETHRLAIALLVEAAERPAVPGAALARLRDFVVANLRHHHETEDELLWPLIAAAAPAAAQELAALSGEHVRLDAALDRLAAVAIEDGRPARVALREAAAAVQEAVQTHLLHEEPVLFPVLREHIAPSEWDDFAHKVIASTPPVAGHLMIGFLDEAGSPAEVEVMLKGMPEPVRALLPELRRQAASDLRVLRGNTA